MTSPSDRPEWLSRVLHKADRSDLIIRSEVNIAQSGLKGQACSRVARKRAIAENAWVQVEKPLTAASTEPMMGA
jgi:hypothetical protein